VKSTNVTHIMIAYYKTSNKIFFSLPISIAVLYGTQLLDARLLKTEFSKIVHLSAFGNLLWFLTVLGGFVSTHIFSKPELLPIYITEGMFLFASFRIGLFT